MLRNPPRQDQLGPPSNTAGLTLDEASGLWLPTTAISDVTGLQAALDAKQNAATAATDAELSAEAVARAAADALLQPLSAKDQANGYAGLDSGGLLPASKLPSSAQEFKGAWNAATNSPSLADGAGNAGDTYRVTAAASRNLGSGAIDFQVGDAVLYDGTTWFKLDNTDAVASVAGRTGAVTLAKGDVGLGSVDNTSDAGKPVSTAQQAALDAKANTSDLSVVALDTQTANYTLVIGDAGKSVMMNSGSARTITVPPNSSVAFPVGTVLGVVRDGAGSVTLVAGAGVTIRSPGGRLALSSQYSSGALWKIATDEWILSGDLS